MVTHSVTGSAPRQQPGGARADIRPCFSGAPRGAEMKVAFLFLTRSGLNCEELWSDFFAGAEPGSFTIYAHTKERPPVDSLLAGRRIAEIVPTEWGTVSLVRATIALLRAALADDNTKFVLCSESCVPLYSFARVREALAADPRAWLSYSPLPSFMVHQKGPTREFIRWNAQLKPIVPSADRLLKQQQWMALSRDLAELFARADTDHTSKWDGGLFAPDEHYFVSVLPYELRRRAPADTYADDGACLETVALNRKLTHVEWGLVGTSRAPLKVLATTEELLARARGEGCLFLRKVAPGADTRLLRASWS